MLRSIDEDNGMTVDQTIRLVNYYTDKDYSEKLRRTKFYDTQVNRIFIFIANNFELTALQIALLYKHCWKIELFFRWMKQHLKIKSLGIFRERR